MLVDPSTGMPLEEESLNPGIAPGSSSITGGVIANTAANAGYEGGRFYNAALHIPSAFATTGWNAYRGSNTIIHGGFSSKQRGRIANHLNPMAATRMSNVGNLDYNGGGYSPFDILSRQGNFWANKLVGGGNRIYKGGLAGSARENSYYSRMRNSGFIDDTMDKAIRGGEKAQFVESGMLSRISASARYASKYGESALTGKSAAAFSRSMGKMAPDIMTMLGASGAASAEMTGNRAAQLTLMSAKTPVGQAIGGYLSGVTHGVGDVRLHRVANSARPIFARAAEKGAAHIALGGGKGIISGAKFAAAGAGEKGAAMAATKFLGASGAKALGLALPGINIAMTAWMAYDLTKMGMSLLAGAPEFAGDAIKSMTGSINKPIMGMGYKDNTVAATSRARGVMAIQNSRLNSRSALGGEAAYLHGHFG